MCHGTAMVFRIKSYDPDQRPFIQISLFLLRSAKVLDDSVSKCFVLFFLFKQIRKKYPPQYIECLEIEKCNMMLSHDDQGVPLSILHFLLLVLKKTGYFTQSYNFLIV